MSVQPSLDLLDKIFLRARENAARAVGEDVLAGAEVFLRWNCPYFRFIGQIKGDLPTMHGYRRPPRKQIRAYLRSEGVQQCSLFSCIHGTKIAIFSKLPARFALAPGFGIKCIILIIIYLWNSANPVPRFLEGCGISCFCKYLIMMCLWKTWIPRNTFSSPRCKIWRIEVF